MSEPFTDSGEMHRIKRDQEDEAGLEIAAKVEHGNVLIDFSKPIQFLGMTLEDLKSFTMMLMAAGIHAANEPPVNKSKLQ